MAELFDCKQIHYHSLRATITVLRIIKDITKCRTSTSQHNRTIPEPFKGSSYDIHVYHEKCNFSRLAFENSENCHASPPPIFFVVEGWGWSGVGDGRGLIHFLFLKRVRSVKE